jgi:hypothetical protein
MLLLRFSQLAARQRTKAYMLLTKLNLYATAAILSAGGATAHESRATCDQAI